MERVKKLKLFISYSHKDNTEEKPLIEEFKTHLAPLKNNSLVKEWYDREIFSGSDFLSEIENNLKNADIICLFISSSFLASENCMEEKNKAIQLNKKRNIPVIPIIVNKCGWKDDEISSFLALPTDGKPVSSFQDRDNAWNNIYDELKKVIEQEIKFRELKIKEKFIDFLQDTEIFKKAHSQKERVLLDDIFIFPDLTKYDSFRENSEIINSKYLYEELLENKRIVIVGEDQSGKTTLCKSLFNELYGKNFLPVYICGKKNIFKKGPLKAISRSFNSQYEGIDFKDVNTNKVVPIVDDFHFTKYKEKIIKALSNYKYFILVVDDIFSINIVEDENFISSFAHYEIKELKPSLRHELIEKWAYLTDKEIKDIEYYKNIDRRTELIDHTIGRSIGRGIMPSYPFFILSVIFTSETSSMPLNQDITSQGYCYQAFITFYLREQRVKNDEINIYMNFLTELAFYFYIEQKFELSPHEFEHFMKIYLEKYNLPIKPAILLENLNQIFSADSLNNYAFRYNYLYYFFVAQYFAEHIEEKEIKKEIKKIMENLHVNENAYIAVFIAHHSRNTNILDELKKNAKSLFSEFKPASLTKSEVEFFDKEVDIIVEAALPSNNTNHDTERKKRLKIKDELEENGYDEEDEEEFESDLKIELRRSIKTVEVMGCIIKNRAGSLEKKELEYLFKEAMNVHLRSLTNFFEIIKNEKEQQIFIELISNRLQKIIEEESDKDKLDNDKLRKMAEILFWNMNFFVVIGIINKIVHSLGSDKLNLIMDNVCDELNTPSSFMVKQGILMWYQKNLRLDEIADRIQKNDYSQLAAKTTKLMVVEHYSVHDISFRDKQRIKDKLGIRGKMLGNRKELSD
jgi:hypothetical protein